MEEPPTRQHTTIRSLAHQGEDGSPQGRDDAFSSARFTTAVRKAAPPPDPTSSQGSFRPVRKISKCPRTSAKDTYCRAPPPTLICLLNRLYIGRLWHMTSYGGEYGWCY